MARRSNKNATQEEPIKDELEKESIQETIEEDIPPSDEKPPEVEPEASTPEDSPKPDESEIPKDDEEASISLVKTEVEQSGQTKVEHSEDIRPEPKPKVPGVETYIVTSKKRMKIAGREYPEGEPIMLVEARLGLSPRHVFEQMGRLYSLNKES